MTENLRYITISGSYRKFPKEIEEVIQNFQDRGVIVLSPKSAQIVSCVGGFVTLQGDAIKKLNNFSSNDISQAIRSIEDNHVDAIRQSDALWLALPEGYC